MFPRRKRLSREAFPVALAKGKRLSSAHFSMVAPTQAAGYAVVVSKKVARLSVTRHRIKRRVLAILRTFPVGVLPPALIVFPKASASSVSYEDTRAEIAHLLSNITQRRNTLL